MRCSVPAVSWAARVIVKNELATRSDGSKRAFMFSPPGTRCAVEDYLATRRLNGS
jgi:hypothetical protein